jgi:hypothetical protein
MRFSEYFQLGLSQAQLDFVDISPEHDTGLYLDPLALETRHDQFSSDCGDCIRTFFEELLDALRRQDDAYCDELMSHLHEPQETFLGMSKEDPNGRGLGKEQGRQILEALRASRAAETGVLSDLSESSLFIDGIDKDKISDLTTNVIRGPLIRYTEEQCRLHNITALQAYGGPPIWNPVDRVWQGRESMLPSIDGKPIMLVPKFAVRREASLRGREFYDKHMVEFLRQERQAAVSLARAIRGKIPRVTKKEIKERHPLHSKAILVEFAKRHPDILEQYKQAKGENKSLDPSKIEEGFDEAEFARILQQELKAIPAGPADAGRYHSFMIGLLTFLFHPSMISPIKEAEINQGRKRIDIRFTNAFQTPFFDRVLRAPQMRALSVMVECKNYSKDIGNPELDQLAGRFNDVRGWFGIQTCRQVNDWDAVNERCRDLARDRHGFIIVLADEDLDIMLQAIRDSQRANLEVLLNRKLDRLLR